MSYSNATRAYLEHEEFEKGFCCGCGAVEIENGLFDCPANFDPSDSGCEQRDRYKEIVTALKEIDMMWGGNMQ